MAVSLASSGAHLYKPTFFENLHVLRYSWATHLEVLCDRVHVHWSVGDELENIATRWVGNGLKNVSAHNGVLCVSEWLLIYEFDHASANCWW